MNHIQLMGSKAVAMLACRVKFPACFVCSLSGSKRLSWITAIILFVIMSCENTSLISEKLLGEENFQVSTIEDVELAFSTLRYDSLPTSNSQVVMIGQHHQRGIGELTARAFFVPGLGSTGYSVNEDHHTYDSLVLILSPAGQSYFQSDTALRIRVYQLTSELESGSNGSLYNTSVIEGDRLLVGEGTIDADLEENDKVVFGLSNMLGKDLFDRMVEGDEIFTSSEEFNEHIKGFEISAEDFTQSPLMTFYGDSLALRLYYTDRSSLPPSRKYFDFIKTEYYGLYYSQVMSKVESEPIQNLKNYEDRASSNDMDHRAYVSGGSNCATVIEFPTIRDLLLEGQDNIITTATLHIYPDQESDIVGNPLPENLEVYIVDRNNNVLNSDFYSPTFNYDENFKRDTYYEVDITDFIHLLLEPYSNYEYALMVTVPKSEVATSGYHIAFEDGSLRSKLTLYTITSNEQ